MKQSLLFAALIISVLFISCSDDASVTDNQDNILELVKTVKYIPTQEAYENDVEGSLKNLQYFENNKVVADTTFDTSGNIAQRVMHTYTGNTHIAETWMDEALWTTRTFIYDSENRIIERRGVLHNSGMPYNPTGIEKFVYATGSITRNAYDPDTNEVMPQYTYALTLNSQGLISGVIDIDNAFVYENDKLVQLNDSGIVANLEYYDVTMPVNTVKSVNEINNLFFESDDYRIGMAENNNNYLKRYIFTLPLEPENVYVTFEKTFNELGYITYSKAVGEAYQNQRDSETFYYYE